VRRRNRDPIRRLHQAGTERSGMDPIAGTATVEVDFIVARFGADARGRCEQVRIAAAELQCQRSLGRREMQQTRAVAMDDGGRGDHLGIQQHAGEKARRRYRQWRSVQSIMGLPLLSGQSPGPPALTFEASRIGVAVVPRNTLITRTLVTRTPSALTCWRCESACGAMQVNPYMASRESRDLPACEQSDILPAACTRLSATGRSEASRSGCSIIESILELPRKTFIIIVYLYTAL